MSGGAWRYTTDCATGHHIWRYYASIGRPERSFWCPCAKAAALAVPLAIGPSLFVPGAVPPSALSPVPPAPPAWHEGRGFVPIPQPLPSYGGAGQGAAHSLEYIPPGESSPLSTGFSTLTPEQFAVPEPASLVVLAVGAGAAVLVRRRRG